MPVTRRAALFAAATAIPLRGAGTKIRLGGPIFLRSADPAELAREHRRLGYSAAYCPDTKIEDAARVERAYAAENVVIAEVGAWRNMLDPDSAKRKANIDYVIQRCALADAVGARCCVNIAGSFNPEIWYGMHPKNLSKEFFDATVENCRRVIDAVKPKRAKFTIEMMPWSLPDDPDSYLELIRAIDRSAFAVHLDVCNIISDPRRFYDTGAVIRDCFARLGRWITSCHAKDLQWVPEYNVHFLEVVPGRGKVDYRAYLTELSKLPSDPPLMLEHLKTAAEYDEGRAYIQKIAAETGLSFA